MNCREIVLYIRSCQENDSFRTWVLHRKHGGGSATPRGKIPHSLPQQWDKGRDTQKPGCSHCLQLQ